MLRNKITKPSEQLPPRRLLRFDFNLACRQVLADHPSLGDHTTFLMCVPDSGRTGYLQTIATPTAANDTLQSLSWRHELRQQLNKLRERKSSVAVIVEGSPRRAVVFTPRSQLRGVYPHAAAMLFFEFDHEIGHLLTRHGDYKSQGPVMAENSADAYAAIRAIQRFGGTPPHLNAMSQTRAEHIVTRASRRHVSTTTLDAIIADSRNIDFGSLTPAETVAAAEEYARRHSPSEAQASFAVSYLAGMYKFKDDPQQLRRLAQTALQTQNRFVFTTASRCLMPALAAASTPGVSAEMRAHLALSLQARALKLGLTDTLQLLRDAAGPLPKLEVSRKEQKGGGGLRYKR